MEYVITIGRQFGSGGHEVGSRLAKKLGIPFYDEELLTITAENSQFAESFLEKVDEKKPGFMSLGVTGVSMGDAMLGNYYQLSANDRAFVETGKTMHLLARKGPCVIVGRCADYVLRDVPVINFFISADIKDRVARKTALEKESNLSADEMEKKILAVDKNRSKYYEYYSHEKWGDSAHYNLCINTSSVGVDGAVNILENYINEFGKKNIMPD